MYSQRCLDLIRKWEGLRLHSYRDGKGFWTIGIGHLMEPQGDSCAGTVIDLATAEAMFLEDVDTAYDALDGLALSQGEVDALTSWVFAFGAHRFHGSTLYALLSAGSYAQAADELLKWDHEGSKEVAGLKARRIEERALFLEAP